MKIPLNLSIYYNNFFVCICRSFHKVVRTLFIFFVLIWSYYIVMYKIHISLVKTDLFGLYVSPLRVLW